MKTNQDFHLVDKAIYQKIMAEQTDTWTEQCQTCKGTGQMQSLPKNEILQCTNCLGEGEIEYER